VSRRLFKDLEHQSDAQVALNLVANILSERFSFLNFVVLYVAKSEVHMYPSSGAKTFAQIVGRYLESLCSQNVDGLEFVLSNLDDKSMGYAYDDRRPVFLKLANKGRLSQDSLIGVFVRGRDLQSIAGSAQQEFLGFAEYLVDNSLAILDKQGLALDAVSGKSAVAPQLCHDLRAPLSNIKAILSLFESGSTDAESFKTLVSIAQTSCNSLKLLVDDLLDYLQGGQARPPRPDTFCLVRLAQEVREEYLMLAGLKGLQLLSVSELETSYVFADYLHIRRVLCNLVSNAIKYSSVGKIEIRVKNADNNSVVLSVADSGCGSLRSETIASSPDLIVQDSFGLGLLVVRQLLQANGSSLQVSSNAETGSCFSCSLRLAA
jgi:signal transduction histidine kinase